MNKNTFACAVVFCSFLAVSSRAVPVGTSNTEMDYTISAQSFRNWCWGVYAEGREREADVLGTKDIVMKHGRVMGYVGYDVLPGITFYATAGAGNTDFDRLDSESAFEYGAGLNLNFLDHQILDPTLFEDRLRLNGNVQFTMGSVDLEPDGQESQPVEWQEVFASLVVSVVNDCAGEKHFSPFAISIFAGPIYSEYLGGDLDAKTEFGLTAGMEIFYGLNLTISGGIEAFDDKVGYVAGLHFRF